MSRDKDERVLLSYAESLALKALADEKGLSKSSMMRFIFLAYLENHRESEVFADIRRVNRPEAG